MKRTPLTRRIPLPPPTKPMKRTRIAPISKKKRKQDAQSKSLHDLYRAEFPACQCGCGRKATSIHEILGGPWRQSARALRSCILHLAEIPCHRRIQSLNKPAQFALKLASDPWGFSLSEPLAVWGRAPLAITIDEVLAHMPKDLPSADECRLTREHWERKVTNLRRLLREAEDNLAAAIVEHVNARIREEKIADARK